VPDQPLTTPEKDTAPDEPGLFQSAYETVKEGYETIKSYLTGDDNKTLEKSGALPDFKIDGKEAKADAKDAKGEVKDTTADTKDAKGDSKDAKADTKDVKGDGKEAKSDATDGKADPKTEAPTSKDFIKQHPEFKLLSPKEEAVLQKDLEAKQKQLDADSAKYQHLMDVGEKYMKISADLQQATGKTTESEAAAEFKNLPPEKQQEFVKRFDEIKADLPEVKNVVKLAEKVEKEEKQVAAVKEKMAFTHDVQAIDKLPGEQRAEFYKSFDKLMDKNDKTQTTGLSANERIAIVKDIAHNIAEPQDVKQGIKGTCALASTEYVLARSHPDVYAKSVSEFATKGEYMGAKISNDEIHKDDGNALRGMASKVFQTGAAELALQEQGSHYDNYKPGEAPKVTAGRSPTPADDTGERLVDKDGKVRNWPGLTTDQEVELINKLTGTPYESEKLYAHSSKMLQKQLEAEVEKYGYPLKVGFYYDNSAHAVTITGIDKTTDPPKIVYDDTAQPRGKTQTMDMQKFYELALNGPNVYKVGNRPMILLTAAPKGERIDPYVEVIHKK
jgi:hypothetical protein